MDFNVVQKIHGLSGIQETAMVNLWVEISERYQYEFKDHVKIRRTSFKTSDGDQAYVLVSLSNALMDALGILQSGDSTDHQTEKPIKTLSGFKSLQDFMTETKLEPPTSQHTKQF
jgi:hypothetical protein